MANDPQHTDMSPAEVQDRIWELAEKIDFAMFTTWDGERQRSRPMSSRIRRDEHAVYYLVDDSAASTWQIEKFPYVSLAFADNAGHKYVVISGKATLSNNRSKIKDLWSDMDKAWWDDENDPNIRLITVTPEDGELWDSPNRAVATAKMLVAAVTGAKPSFGDNAKTDL